MSEFPLYPKENDERERRRADAQALADVRTLDKWAERNAGWWHTDTYLTPGLRAWTCRLETPKRAALYSVIGATPDEARAKAAAYARGLLPDQPHDGGGKVGE